MDSAIPQNENLATDPSFKVKSPPSSSDGEVLKNELENRTESRQKRKSRNSDPIYKYPLTLSELVKKQVLSAVGGRAEKRRRESPHLTFNRKEVIQRYLYDNRIQPGKFGRVGSKMWIEALILRLEKSAGDTDELIAPSDVSDWLKTPPFSQTTESLKRWQAKAEWTLASNSSVLDSQPFPTLSPLTSYESSSSARNVLEEEGRAEIQIKFAENWQPIFANTNVIVSGGSLKDKVKQHQQNKSPADDTTDPLELIEVTREPSPDAMSSVSPPWQDLSSSSPPPGERGRSNMELESAPQLQSSSSSYKPGESWPLT